MRHLFILLLISVGISARFRHYHFIEDPKKNWTDARSYCRERYTDLATIDNETVIQDIISDIKYESWLWIGLHREDTNSKQPTKDSGVVKDWRWSDNSDLTVKHWDQREPSGGQFENCVEAKYTDSERGWNDKGCHFPLPFLCHKNDDEIPIILIRDNKTWEEALDYCREHHEDLASVHNEDIQKWVQKRAEQADGPYVWLGLRYTCTLEFWFWVNEEPMCYQNWSPGSQNGDCEMSGAMETGGNHSWVSLSDAGRFNFICSTGDMGEGDMGAPQCHTCDR